MWAWLGESTDSNQSISFQLLNNTCMSNDSLAHEMLIFLFCQDFEALQAVNSNLFNALWFTSLHLNYRPSSPPSCPDG